MSQVATTGMGPVYIRKDVFGRVFFDRCASDEELLTKPAEPGEERSTCRRYVEKLFDSIVGKHGFVSVEVFFAQDGSVAGSTAVGTMP